MSCEHCTDPDARVAGIRWRVQEVIKTYES